MHTIRVENVNEALPIAIRLLQEDSRTIAPRGANTLEYPTPVTTVYENPTERVMLWKERDANPFFHLFESIWILQGRQDVAWLEQFNSNIANYSDNGTVFHAPYGYRLRGATRLFAYDQVQTALEMLSRYKDTRRAVLQIWDKNLDLNARSKDIPCNTVVFLKIRDNRLNITVCCRSNDIIWGAYGANVVQFSMLQEYMSSMIGVEVGEYRQVSDSFHVYTDSPQWETLKNIPYTDFNPYRYDVEPYPIMDSPKYWDSDARLFMSHTETVGMPEKYSYKNSWFAAVLAPMYVCWRQHKLNRDGIKYVGNIEATDWRMAAKQWLTKREGVQ